MNDSRAWFQLSHRGFSELLTALAAERNITWEAPALGSWDLRALLGHTCRAYQTIEAYLEPGTRCDAPDLAHPAEYFARMLRLQTTAAEVAARGVSAGQALGRDPAHAGLEIAERVYTLVASTPDIALVTTPAGTMQLVDYLATRSFELTVHGTDLAVAAGLEIPEPLDAALAPALELSAALTTSAKRLTLLRAATGRTVLPEGFSVLAG